MKRNVLFQFICPGCNSKVKIEFTDPMRTGAGGTVDCPVCGTSKMIPDEPVRVLHEKDGQWVESVPHTSHFR